MTLPARRDIKVSNRCKSGQQTVKGIFIIFDNSNLLYNGYQIDNFKKIAMCILSYLQW